MRDPNRIERILGLLRRAWWGCPDLRLGQLLLDVAERSGSPYYVEDDEWEKLLSEFIERHSDE